MPAIPTGLRPAALTPVPGHQFGPRSHPDSTPVSAGRRSIAPLQKAWPRAVDPDRKPAEGGAAGEMRLTVGPGRRSHAIVRRRRHVKAVYLAGERRVRVGLATHPGGANQAWNSKREDHLPENLAHGFVIPLLIPSVIVSTPSGLTDVARKRPRPDRQSAIVGRSAAAPFVQPV
jgi:hypothetical protein